MALTRGLDLVPVGAEEALAELRVPGAGGHRGAPLAPVVEPGQRIVRGEGSALPGCLLQLATNFREDFTIMDNAPNVLGPSPY